MSAKSSRGSAQKRRHAAHFDVKKTLDLALAHHRQGDRAAAEPLYRRLLDRNPDDPGVLYLHGLLNSEMGRGEIAEPLLLRSVALRPGNADGHAALANLRQSLGREAEAIAGYEQALSLQPDHRFALTNLAALLLARGFDAHDDIEGAIQVCQAAIRLLPDPAPAHALLGKLLLAANRPVEALEAYRMAISLAPDTLASWAGLALALQGSGDNAQALQAADALLALDPDQLDGLFVRGAALVALHQPAAAIGAFERGLALDPGAGRMHFGLGNAYTQLDRPDDALAHFFQALAINPESSAILANLGSIHWRRGDLAEAERLSRLALDKSPDLIVAHRNLAGVYTDMGDLVQARHHRDTALNLCNLYVDQAANPRAKVLVLTTSDSGNIPHKHLLPADQFTRINWFIEYARPGQAVELPPYDVVFNIIGDADFADQADAPVAVFLAQCRKPALNGQAQVAATRRDRLPALLRDIPALVIPQTDRFEAQALCREGLPALIAKAGQTGPVLIRPFGSHGGLGLTLAASQAALEAIDVTGAEGVYATAFADFASPADGLYRKYRVIFVDRTPYPYHLAISKHWLIHYYTAQMDGDDARQAEEMQFLEDPQAALGEPAVAALAAIGARLDLDYAGIDFSILPDGRVLVFEANATMLVHPETEAEFSHKNPYINRIIGAFQALVERRAKAG